MYWLKYKFDIGTLWIKVKIKQFTFFFFFISVYLIHEIHSSLVFYFFNALVINFKLCFMLSTMTWWAQFMHGCKYIDNKNLSNFRYHSLRSWRTPCKVSLIGQSTWRVSAKWSIFLERRQVLDGPHSLPLDRWKNFEPARWVDLGCCQVLLPFCVTFKLFWKICLKI